MASSTMNFLQDPFAFLAIAVPGGTLMCGRDSSPLLALEPFAHASKLPSIASQSRLLAPQQNLVPSRLLFRSVWGSRTTFC